MLVIRDVLISDEIAEEKFMCDLKSCKGACCTEGDYGAPVDKMEMDLINSHLSQLKSTLNPESVALIDREGAFTYYRKPKKWGTTCHENGDCVFLVRDQTGISYCGIEKNQREGKSTCQKPLSCHLYPIRVTSNEIAGFEAWNYDRWDICKSACVQGQKEKMPVYKFLKQAIIRYKGPEFYDELEAAANHMNQSDTNKQPH